MHNLHTMDSKKTTKIWHILHNFTYSSKERLTSYFHLLILSVPVLKKIKIILLMKILKVGSSVRSNRCLHTAGTVLLLSSKKIFFLPQRPQTLLQFVIDSMLNELMVKTVRAKWGETERCLSCHAIPGNCAEKGNSQKALAKLSKISSKKWGILDHSCFSLLTD